MPESTFDLSFKNIVSSIPAKIAMTAPPTMGNIFPRNQAGAAIAKQSIIPYPFFLTKSIFIKPSFLIISGNRCIISMFY